METELLNDLATDLPDGVRLQRATTTIRAAFSCDAVGLLMLDDNNTLHLVAASGLAHEALGRRFVVGQHPRFATILSQRDPTWFDPGSVLPDPYDGLLDDRKGSPLPVHDCLGLALYHQDRPWGIMTLDALTTGTFDEAARHRLRRLGLILQAAVRVSNLERETRQLRQLGSSQQGIERIGEASEILGHSEAIQSLLHELDLVADSDLPILLLGETGVGKELFARRLHRHSRRSQQTMIQVNCAALPESLAESELFGHVKGAFSGATSDRPGRFEAAQGGTLFLDEVGELPLSLQAKLLRVLQNGEIQRLGTDQTIKTDVRIIAATNRDLKANTQAGLFRADLYHRLSVYPIPIPPLRERGRDVQILAGHFLEFNRARLGLRGVRLSYAAEQALQQYPWPGNVRELEHVISRAALKMLSRGASRDQVLTIEAELLDLDIVPAIGENQRESAASLGAGGLPAAAGQPLGLADIPLLRTTVDTCQQQAIHQALIAADGNWAQAAKALGLDASNLHKLAKRLGMKKRIETFSPGAHPT
ncbi:nitric oxide reductase transcriptional regulator NorR [Castellaniella sp.]|uniref:nitric oxide reductase transcriptional regulator NorR n=1 Tax=Castellaniella sp. TaxID=1955812 RepID=UPI002AFECE17|nr:nitric oxide reductase transcriptional regulator NorR [Castellaniella sp.]